MMFMFPTEGLANDSDLRVRTVLGDIDSENLGITLPHEHIFADLGCYWHLPTDPYMQKYVDEFVRIDNLWVLHRDPYIIKDNLTLSDKKTAIRELSDFKFAGGSTIVDMTSVGLSPRPDLLVEVAKETGLNIVAGCGYYITSSHPSWLAEAGVEDIVDRLKHDIEDGVGGTQTRPGVIGEIGISPKMTAAEDRVLRAAARMHLAAKLPLNIHTTPYGDGWKECDRILDILEEEGVELSRVTLSHMDFVIDLEDVVRLAKRGPYIEYDCFGEEEYVDSSAFINPRDIERVRALSRLVHMGFIDQLLVSQDVCLKMYLKTYGGPGYDHILRNIIPMMRQMRISERDITRMIAENPAKALSF